MASLKQKLSVFPEEKSDKTLLELQKSDSGIPTVNLDEKLNNWIKTTDIPEKYIAGENVAFTPTESELIVNKTDTKYTASDKISINKSNTISSEDADRITYTQGTNTIISESKDSGKLQVTPYFIRMPENTNDIHLRSMYFDKSGPLLGGYVNNSVVIPDYYVDDSLTLRIGSKVILYTNTKNETVSSTNLGGSYESIANNLINFNNFQIHTVASGIYFGLDMLKDHIYQNIVLHATPNGIFDIRFNPIRKRGIFLTGFKAGRPVLIHMYTKGEIHIYFNNPSAQNAAEIALTSVREKIETTPLTGQQSKSYVNDEINERDSFDYYINVATSSENITRGSIEIMLINAIENTYINSPDLVKNINWRYNTNITDSTVVDTYYMVNMSE